MKLCQIVVSTLLILGAGCQIPKKEITISGKILGPLPGKVEYTSPINGICNWWFTESVQPDSAGNFQIKLESEQPLFLKLRTSHSEQGTLIVEPGKNYVVVFDLNQKEDVFAVTDTSSVFQQAYEILPNPFHIQIGAREFMRDTVAKDVKNTIEQRRKDEIAVFEKLLSDNMISKGVFDLIETDRNCYYDALLATTAWIKNLQTIHGTAESFPDDFEDLWKETFEQTLFANPQLVNSQWFNFYAESYIYFQEYANGNFTQEKLEELGQSKQIKINHVSKAYEYLPAEICEDYVANYLYLESFQKRYEAELIDLFAGFKTKYPESEYIPYLSPLIDEVIRFHETAQSDFNEQIHFVENYQNLNTLAEVTKAFPEGSKIYVDVWATWCGPCKAEFEHKDELKNLLGKNNIPILYLSIDREKDSVQWKNMIKFYNLEGHHVRANKELDAELRKIFDRNGSLSIPWYILTDNNGNIIKKHASRPSQIEELEKEI